jgi:hypothetical protein
MHESIGRKLVSFDEVVLGFSFQRKTHRGCPVEIYQVNTGRYEGNGDWGYKQVFEEEISFGRIQDLHDTLGVALDGHRSPTSAELVVSVSFWHCSWNLYQRRILIGDGFRGISDRTKCSPIAIYEHSDPDNIDKRIEEEFMKLYDHYKEYNGLK